MLICLKFRFKDGYGIPVRRFSLYSYLCNGKPIKSMTTSNRLLLVSFFAFMTTVVFQSPEIIWNGTLFGGGTLGIWFGIGVIWYDHSGLFIYYRSS